MLSSQEIASMTATVTSALDTTISIKRYTPTTDGYGHATKAYTVIGTAQVNVIKPTASQLQFFADIIGTQTSFMLRYMNGTDIKTGDHIVYISQEWEVQAVNEAGSYVFSNDALITLVAV